MLVLGTRGRRFDPFCPDGVRLLPLLSTIVIRSDCCWASPTTDGLCIIYYILYIIYYILYIVY